MQEGIKLQKEKEGIGKEYEEMGDGKEEREDRGREGIG